MPYCIIGPGLSHYLTMLAYCHLDLWEQTSAIWIKIKSFSVMKMYLNISFVSMSAILFGLQCVAENTRAGPSLNSLAPGRCDFAFKLIIFKLISRIDVLSISCEIALRWMSGNLSDDELTLVEVMGCCRQTASHYLNQCWRSFMWPYGIARPQWFKDYSNSNSNSTVSKY